MVFLSRHVRLWNLDQDLALKSHIGWDYRSTFFILFISVTCGLALHLMTGKKWKDNDVSD